MTQIAFFCSTYPGYTVDTTLGMPAITFFRFLDEAYKVDAREKLSLINIAQSSRVDDISVISGPYEDMLDDEIFDPEDYTAIDKLKGPLAGEV